MGILSSFLGGGGSGGFIGSFFDNFGFGGSGSDGSTGSSSGGLATRVFTSPAFWMAGALVVVVLIK